MIDRLGTALSDRYRIERELGAGGMATVYLADDLKHGRKVAIKVLKPELAAVIGGERFVNEIRTTAALQHPNILPLYDSGVADGFLYYVMPFVAGDTLRDRLEREKQLGVDDALAITRKVADALDYAHSKGVVHRDVKPANILLSERGEPLVADFGIALAVRQAGEGRITETGLSLGTPHYMSPEQATGERDVGPRSDLYALACVLYEMLAGQPPFAAPTAQAVLAHILTESAQRIRSVRPTVPPNVDAALARALEKLPADRFGSVAEFAQALDHPSFRYAGSDPASLRPAGAAGTSARPWRLATAAFALLAAGFGTWAVLLGGSGGDLQVTTRERVVLFDWDALEAADEVSGSVRHGVAISPDGSTLVLRDPENDRLTLKEKHSLDVLPLAGTEGGHTPTFSPDGAWIAFVAGDAVKKVPLRGGSPVTLATGMVEYNQQLAWLDDGRILFNPSGWHLDAVPADGGGTERLVDVSSTGRFVTGVTPLPGSRGVLFQSCGAGCPIPELRVLDLTSGEARTLITGATGGWWLDSGHILFVRVDGGTYLAPFDLATLDLAGPEVPVPGSVATAPQQADLAASSSGTVVYLPGVGRPGSPEVVPVWVSMDGTETEVDAGWSGLIENPVLSPDGRFVAYQEGRVDQAEIMVRELPAGPVVQLTIDEIYNRRPQWIADGRDVAYLAQPEGDGPIRYEVRRADASSPAGVLFAPDEGVYQVEYSTDGRWMIYRTGDATVGAADLWLMDLETDSARPLLAGDYSEHAVRFSRDGRWIAYLSGESGRAEVVVRPFPNVDDALIRISARGGEPPIWAPDGSAIYFIEPATGEMIRVGLSEVEGALQVTERRSLFSGAAYRRNGSDWEFDLSADGTRFLMLRQAESLPDAEDEFGGRAHVIVENLLAEIEGRTGR